MRRVARSGGNARKQLLADTVKSKLSESVFICGTAALILTGCGGNSGEAAPSEIDSLGAEPTYSVGTDYLFSAHTPSPAGMAKALGFEVTYDGGSKDGFTTQAMTPQQCFASFTVERIDAFNTEVTVEVKTSQGSILRPDNDGQLISHTEATSFLDEVAKAGC